MGAQESTEEAPEGALEDGQSPGAANESKEELTTPTRFRRRARSEPPDPRAAEALSPTAIDLRLDEARSPANVDPRLRPPARVRAGDFETHAASCAFRLVPCSRRGLGCAHAVRFKHAEQHFRLCEHRPFACPNRPRCAWRGTRRDVEAHLKKECAWEIAECGLADDDPDGALARSSESKRAYDAATSADGRAYTFGGDALDFSDVSDFSDSVPLVRDARGEQHAARARARAPQLIHGDYDRARVLALHLEGAVQRDERAHAPAALLCEFQRSGAGSERHA